MNASLNTPPKLKSVSSGFTLIELMVTIAVLAIIAAIATPSISIQLANQRVKSTAVILANALKEARVESTIRRQDITFSYDNDGDDAGKIEIENGNGMIATYQYDANSTITSTVSQIEFKPSRTVDAMVYTICDSNASASPRQVVITAITNISSQLGGSC